MKLLKLIPAAAIVLTAFTTFEAKAGYPSGYTKKNACTEASKKYYLLQKTDTPASYGTYSDHDNDWVIENTSYDCAKKVWQKYTCVTPGTKPDCMLDQ